MSEPGSQWSSAPSQTKGKKPKEKKKEKGPKKDLKILLVGCDEAVSSVFRHIQFQHTKFFENLDNRKYFRNVLFHNTISSMQKLIRSLEPLGLQLTGAPLERAYQIMQTNPDELPSKVHFPLQLAYNMKSLWDEQAIRKAFAAIRHRLPKCTEYCFDNLFRILEPNFMPNDHDIVYAFDHKASAQVAEFVWKNQKITVIFPGFSRAQWDAVSDGINELVFVVDLPNFDTFSVRPRGEQEAELNAIRDALLVFQELVNSPFFAYSTHITLVFHDTDGFQRKIASTGVDLKAAGCFHDYAGGPDPEAAMKFIAERFAAKRLYTQRNLTVHHLAGAVGAASAALGTGIGGGGTGAGGDTSYASLSRQIEIVRNLFEEIFRAASDHALNPNDNELVAVSDAAIRGLLQQTQSAHLADQLEALFELEVLTKLEANKALFVREGGLRALVPWLVAAGPNAVSTAHDDGADSVAVAAGAASVYQRTVRLLKRLRSFPEDQLNLTAEELELLRKHGLKTASAEQLAREAQLANPQRRPTDSGDRKPAVSVSPPATEARAAAATGDAAVDAVAGAADLNIAQSTSSLSPSVANGRMSPKELSKDLKRLRRDKIRSSSTSAPSGCAQVTNPIFGMGELLERKRKASIASRAEAEEVIGWRLSTVDSGAHCEQGPRPTQEDAHVVIDDLAAAVSVDAGAGPAAVVSTVATHVGFYAVYDGHGGTNCSAFAERTLHRHLAGCVHFTEGRFAEALRASFESTDAALLTVAAENKWEDGTCAVVAVVVDNSLYVANVGDSEAVLARRRGPGVSTSTSTAEPVVLSFKHRASDPDEKTRVEAAGGCVFRNRVFGTLAVSRALGDVGMKKPAAEGDFISPVPYQASIVPLTKEDELLILACDGLWDVVPYQDAVDVAMKMKTNAASPKEIAAALAGMALQRNTQDNVTVVVVAFRWQPITAGSAKRSRHTRSKSVGHGSENKK